MELASFHLPRIKMYQELCIQVEDLMLISISHSDRCPLGKRLIIVLLIGGLVSSMMIKMKTTIWMNRIISRRTLGMTSTVRSRFKRSPWASTPIEEKRRRVAKLSLATLETAKSWMMLILPLMTSIDYPSSQNRDIIVQMLWLILKSPKFILIRW